MSTPDFFSPSDQGCATAFQFALRREATNKEGFSLIELLIVLFILAIIAAVASPNVSQWLERNRLKTTCRQLTSDLQFAKMKAVAEKTQCAVVFDTANNLYRIQKWDTTLATPAWVTLGADRNLSDSANASYAKGVTMSQNFVNNTVIFTPTGQTSSLGGTATFTTASYTMSVIVAATGRVRIG